MLYILSVISPLLLIASFKPVDLWWLAWVALCPYAYILYNKKRFSDRDSIFAGSVIALIFSVGMAFPALTQFHWYETGRILAIIAQFLWIPISLSAIFLGASGSYLFRKFSDDSFFDILLFAGVWTGIEFIRQIFFNYFDYALIGYAGYAILPVLGFASIGGVLAVSFLISTFNGFLARLVLKGLNRGDLRSASYVIGLILAIYYANYAYLNFGREISDVISVSSIQIDGEEKPFGKLNDKGELILPERTGNIIRAGAFQEPDFLIYPFNLVGGILADEENIPGYQNLFSGRFDQVGDWLKDNIPEKTVFVMWTNTLRSGGFPAAEVNFWKSGQLDQYYQKRKLFPFIDYTPVAVQDAGIYTTPIDYVSGPENQIVQFDGVRFANLICSELNLPDFSRRSAGGSDVIFAIGSAAIFRDSIMGQRNLVLAQFRAVENNLPLVRADRKGPSAIFSADGEVQGYLPFKKNGILRGNIEIEKNRRQTIYGLTGDWGALGGLILIFYLSFRKKRRVLL